MNSRERVLRVFGKIEGKPDRVPVQFEMCRQLYDHFSKELGIPATYTENLYEDVTYRISSNELRVAMGSDVVVTGASVSDDFKIEIDEKGQWYNEYKMKMSQGSLLVILQNQKGGKIYIVLDSKIIPFSSCKKILNGQPKDCP
jgi:uroporphyrinogen decarboxylase